MADQRRIPLSTKAGYTNKPCHATPRATSIPANKVAATPPNWKFTLINPMTVPLRSGGYQLPMVLVNPPQPMDRK